MKKIALAFLSAAALVFGFGVVADAQYGAGGTSTVSPTNPGPGGTFTMTLNGCEPPETVQYTLTLNGSQVDSASAPCASSLSLGSIIGLLAQASANGTSSAQLTLGVTPGSYIATATGLTSGVTSSQTLTVVGTPTPPAGGLPVTGSGGMGPTTQVAIGLLVVGLGLFAVAQIRRRKTTLA